MIGKVYIDIDPDEKFQGNVGLAAGIRLGYRTWWISQTNDGWLLTSNNYLYLWPPYEKAVATCRQEQEHEAPSMEPHTKLERWHRTPRPHPPCGIYAYSQSTLPREEFNRLRNGKPGKVFAIGKVKLWGRTVEHEHGLRSQFAYPKSILVADYRGRDSKLTDEIVSTYGCEVFNLP